MAADLHIHAFHDDKQPVSEESFRCFFGNTLGSKYGPKIEDIMAGRFGADRCPDIDCEHWKQINETPNVWVGEVSWLKAGLTEDPDAYVPKGVEGVHAAIGEDNPVIDDELIENVTRALTLENNTGYSLASAEDVIKFLEEHRGWKAFTISW